MQDLYNNVDAVHAFTGTLSGSPGLSSAAIDLQFYESCDVVLALDNMDELGTSPVGTASASLALDHSTDGTTWTACVLADVIGPTTALSDGIVATTTGEYTTIHGGYRMERRYIRVRAEHTGLTNGGTVTAIVLKGRFRHEGGVAV